MRTNLEKPLVKHQWAKPLVGYKAKLDGEVVFILARNRWVLRGFHAALFPETKFNRKMCHPAQIRRVK